MGGHENQFALANTRGLAGDGDFHLSFQHLHQSVERRGVLAETFLCVKSEQGHLPGGFFDDFPADNRARLVIEPG